MQIKLSKTLETLLYSGREIYDQGDAESYNVDDIFVAILGNANSHATHILSKILKQWELYQIKIKIERDIARTKVSGTDQISVSSGELMEAIMLASLGTSGRGNGNIGFANTGHLLIAIICNRKFISSRILESYAITADKVAEYVSQLPMEEDFYEDMYALQRYSLPSQVGRLSMDDLEQYEDYVEEEDYNSVKHSVKPKNSPRPASSLEKYGVNLSKSASMGEIDPVIGRDAEIERMIQILGRRKKNNPILIGEAGVGKSAIVEGLALRIHSRSVPLSLRDKMVFSLDLSSLVAGTKYRGQFEERINAIISELSANRNVILFIDEIHTIVGAGSTQGSLDTANILKPALARGHLQCIGATTLDEYREQIESDSALERRFQKIIIEPTTKEQTLKILQNIKHQYEQYHKVFYTDEALKACVELTDRYITDRNFPDKAIDVLDEAGSKAHLFSIKEPDHIVELENQMQQLKEQTLNPYSITAEHIELVITTMTGIPVEKVSRGEMGRLNGMQSYLDAIIIGQQLAVTKVSKSIQRSRAGLKDPNKPIGVFLFVGPTGVGKTHLAKELSKWMFDKDQALIRVDMSEYSEKHNVSRLIGSPPGYVGYAEGGQLSESVRRQPYAVVLFDEIEKAHSDVFNIMLQIFDEGHLTDGLGRKIDFRNTIIIMTSNIGSRAIAQKGSSVGYNTTNKSNIDTVNVDSEYRRSLENTFAPEFINRIDDIVVFNTLSEQDILHIVDIELNGLKKRAASLGYTLNVSDKAKSSLAEMGYESRYGVRSLKRKILDSIEEPLALMIVGGEVENGDTIEIIDRDQKIELLKLAV